MNPYAVIRVDVYRPDMGDKEGLVFQERLAQPLEWVTEKRCYSYLAYNFEDMINRVRDEMSRQR